MNLPLRRLGPTGISVSALGLGGLTFGRETTADEAAVMIHNYLDAGGNLIDTANIYGRGRSEEIIGAALTGRRDGVVLMSKARFRMGPHPNDAGSSRRHLLAALDGSLRRLRTDHLDVWLLHGWDPATPLTETLSTMDDVVRAGKVRYVGASIFTAWQLAHALGLTAAKGLTPITVVSPEYSLASREAERDILPFCAAAGLAVLVWSPLGGGLLTGKYRPDVAPAPDTRAGDVGRVGAAARQRLTPASLEAADRLAVLAARLDRTPAQVALNWLVHRPTVTAAIVGARTSAQLASNLDAVGWSLAEDDRAELDAVAPIAPSYPYDVDDEDGHANTVLRTPWRE